MCFPSWSGPDPGGKAADVRKHCNLVTPGCTLTNLISYDASRFLSNHSFMCMYMYMCVCVAPRIIESAKIDEISSLSNNSSRRWQTMTDDDITVSSFHLWIHPPPLDPRFGANDFITKIFSTILNRRGTTVKSMSLVSLVPIFVSIMETVHHPEETIQLTTLINPNSTSTVKLESLLSPLFWRDRFLIMV